VLKKLKGVAANDNDEIVNIWRKEVMSVGVVRQESGHSSCDRLIDLVSESGHMRTDDLVTPL
jgi:hypothetical protein